MPAGSSAKIWKGCCRSWSKTNIGWANYLAPVVSGAPGESPLTGELSESFCSTDPVVARIFAQATFFSDNRSDLKHVSRPCLIVQHQIDALAPLGVGDYLHEHLNGSTLKVIEATGHCAHMSHPTLVIDAMKRYFADQGARTQSGKRTWNFWTKFPVRCSPPMVQDAYFLPTTSYCA